MDRLNEYRMGEWMEDGGCWRDESGEMAVFNWRGGCSALSMMHIGMDGGEWVEDGFVRDGT